MIVHAVSIHTGGGKVLLDQLLTENIFGEVKILICDNRYSLPLNMNSNLKIYRIKSNLFSRWKAEFLLKKISIQNPSLQILCFANLPPAFKLKNNVILYLQNALLLPGKSLHSLSIKTSIRINYEKIWLNLFINNINELWVQSLSMKNGVTIFNKPILLKPFLPKLPLKNFHGNKKYELISVTGTTPHKRLKLLLETWIYWGISAPKLLIISDKPSDEIIVLLEQISSNCIEFKTDVSRDEIYQFYQESECLIITSQVESFCLPLYEAQHFKLKILGPSEPFVNDFGEIDGFIELGTVFDLKNSIEKNLKLLKKSNQIKIEP